MKKFSKILSVALLVALVLSLGVASAFADPTHSITITNTNGNISIAGKTYNAYKLFDSTHQGDAYAYTMSTESPFYSTQLTSAEDPTEGSLAELLRTYFTFTTIDGDSTKINVEPKAGFDETAARALADAIEDFLPANPTAWGTASGETCVIDLSAATAGQGYYIVTGNADAVNGKANDKEVVSAVIITNEDPNPVVKPKADAPSLNKKITKVTEKDNTDVSEDAILDDEGKAAVAKVGSAVTYTLTSVVPDMTGYDDYTYIIKDSISSGLTYVSSTFVLTIGTGDDNTVAIDPVFASDNKSFTLTIPYDTLSQYAKGTAITLTYDCTVNENALTIDYENNTARLEYSSNPYEDETNHTPDSKTYVIDINVDLNKYTGSATDPNGKLEGAEFKLYREVGTATPKTKQYYKWDTTNKVVDWTTNENEADVFATNDEGKLTQQIRGLDQGTYFLLETQAPSGYNKLAGPVEFTISVSEADGTVTYTSAPGTVNGGVIELGADHEAQPVDIIDVENNSGVQLPSTGGIGTTIFYVVGGVLVLAAIILLVTKKRMSE